MDPALGYIATGLVSFTVGALLKYIEPKAQIYFWWPHTFRFKPKDDIEIQTDSLTVQNLGRKSAENVEIVMENRPDCFHFFPPVPFEEINNADGHFILRIHTLAPKEFFTIQILSYRILPNVVNIRCSSGNAQKFNFQIQKVYPTWMNLTALILMMLGLAVIIYTLICVVRLF